MRGAAATPGAHAMETGGSAVSMRRGRPGSGSCSSEIKGHQLSCRQQGASQAAAPSLPGIQVGTPGRMIALLDLEVFLRELGPVCSPPGAPGARRGKTVWPQLCSVTQQRTIRR